MRTICIILARAGSKGLPDKNALTVSGKPMVAWTIEHALDSRRIDDVVLSTDSHAISMVGVEYGVTVYQRPEDLAGDTATIDAAARHAIEKFEGDTKAQCDRVVVLYGNIPVRPNDLSDRALAKLDETDCDSVQSVNPVGKFHPYWMKQLGGDHGDELLMYQENAIYRRQDLPPLYMLDGGVIAVTRESLFKVEQGQPHAFLGTNRRAVITAPGEVIDVDNELDLALAETILNRKRPRKSPRDLRLTGTG
jgi:CMP-N-acetylneuraminic acid synthetase